MATIAMKVVDKSKEQMTSAKEHVKQTAEDTKQHVDAALTKVRGQTWSEPLGKACYVTGSIVQGQSLGELSPSVVRCSTQRLL